VVDFSEYCRHLETHLCRKNGGHLIRIVGPAFELVRGWAEQGVPLKIACGGIDRYCERQQARAPRRRPVRIEFCEADILSLFDDWRRAVGIVQASGSGDSPAAGRKASLASHIERVVSKLVGRRTPRSAVFERHVENVLAEIDRLAADAKRARGEARAAIVDRLESLDRALMDAAMADLEAPMAEALRREAEAELAAFGTRMASEARFRAIDAAHQRLVRESLGLPIVRFT
jgi:hypothetical protein